MKTIIALFAVLLSFNTLAQGNYPKGPDARLTPGSFCDTPDRYRHPEQIPYCERDVNSFLKEHVFNIYRQQLGYSLSGDRMNYKVDHYIPLCMGGSNKIDNLWPQHVSVGTLTDPVESIGCEVLGKGKITNAEMVDLIKQVKNNPKDSQKVFNYLKKLRSK